MFCESAEQWPAAELIADRYGFTLSDQSPPLAASTAFLQWYDQTLTCRMPDGNRILSMTFDFSAGRNHHRRLFGGGRNQPLCKAVGVKPGFEPRVLDLTAGTGRDAFVLANIGCRVDMVERSAVIAALLDNALQRAAADNELTAVCERLQLHHQDSLSILQQLSESDFPDSIYLDPMYPERRKSALVKKEMRFLRQLVGHDDDCSQLLELAVQRVRKRVAVKRPKGAPYLAGIKPHASISSPNTRYDIYMPRG